MIILTGMSLKTVNKPLNTLCSGVIFFQLLLLIQKRLFFSQRSF